jgi:hypothetical protein
METPLTYQEQVEILAGVVLAINGVLPADKRLLFRTLLGEAGRAELQERPARLLQRLGDALSRGE